MAEDEKEIITSVSKKRGRPKKDEAPVSNEVSKMVTMSHDDVGVVKDSIPEKITISDLQKRWTNMMGKYSSVGFEGIMSAYNKGMSALNNPFIQNKRVKKINTSPLKMDKEKLTKALANPEGCEQSLRGMSWFLYYTNYVYYTLIQLNRNTPKYCWYVLPQYLEKGVDETKLEADSIRIDKAIKKFNPGVTLKNISTQVNIEGKSTYLVRTSYDKKDVNFLVLQKLDSNQIKITGFGSKQQFVVSFNMMIFLEAGYDVSQYPKFIQDTWAKMQEDGIITKDAKGSVRFNPKANRPQGHMLESVEGRYMYWCKLPQDLAWTFYEDGGHPNAFSGAISMFPDFENLGDYQWLQNNLLTKGLNAIMTAEIPFSKDAKAGGDATLPSPDVILGYTGMWNDMVSENIGFFAAPFVDFDLHTLESQPEAMNIIYDRIRDLYTTAGYSALIPLTDKPSISSVQTARMLQESKTDFLTKQFESFLNYFINENLSLNYEWRVTLHSGIFNWREDAKAVKELVLQGCKGLLPKLLSYYDYTLEDYRGAEKYIDLYNIEIKSDVQKASERLQIRAQEYQEKNEVGRPKVKDDEVTNDNTGLSRETGGNISETKEYSLELVNEILDNM